MDKISAGLVVPVSSDTAIAYVYLDIMKKRKHAVKSAYTLETSKKTLMKALMGALHTGGFLFGNNGKGAIAPVIVNATIQQLVVAVLAFVFSRPSTAEDTIGLYDYVVSTADRLRAMRMKDVSAPEGSEGSEGSK